MISRWPANARGVTRQGGLRLQHSFSSGTYHDPARMGFGALRVLDISCLAASAEMPLERRANMEILTLVTDGKVEVFAGDHRNAMRSGDLFWLGAGSGIEQSFVNASDNPCTFVQMWLQPTRVNVEPCFSLRPYRQVEFRHGGWLVASGRVDSVGEDLLPIRADADVRLARLARNESLHQDIPAERRLWIQVLRGAIAVDHVSAEAGDGLAVTNRSDIRIEAGDDSELLLIELA